MPQSIISMIAECIAKGDMTEAQRIAQSDGGAVPEDVRKAMISATGIAIGGTITPAAAQQYFATVVDQSSFLNRVSSAQVAALEQDVDLFDIAPKALQRVAEGSEPSTLTGASNLGKKWALKDVQLFASIGFSTLVQRQKQGDIDAYLAGLFAMAFRNDLLLLGLIGDETSSGFDALNDGWFEKSKDAAASTARDLTNVNEAVTVVSHGAVTGGPFSAGETVTGGTSSATGVVALVGDTYLKLVSVSGTFQLAETITGGTSSASATVTNIYTSGLDYVSTMYNMMQKLSDEYLIEGRTAFIMSVKDAIAWGHQMALKDGLNPYLISSRPKTFEGFEVIGVPGAPSNKFVLTDPRNWAFGMGMTIQRFRDIVGRKRCIEYTWNLYCDYLVLNDEAVVYSD